MPVSGILLLRKRHIVATLMRGGIKCFSFCTMLMLPSCPYLLQSLLAHQAGDPPESPKTCAVRPLAL